MTGPPRRVNPARRQADSPVARDNQPGRQATTRPTLGRPRHADDDAIFRAVLTTLAKLGFTRLSFAAVGREVGISASALHQRFGSKEGLLRVFVEWNNAQLRADVDARRREGRAALDTLAAVLRDWLVGPADREHGARVLALYSEVAAKPQLREPVAARFDTMTNEVEMLLMSAVQTGELQACDAPRLARAILAAGAGTVLLHWLTRPREALDEQLHVAVDAILAPFGGRRLTRSLRTTPR